LIEPAQLFLGASNPTMTSPIMITCDCGSIVNKKGLRAHMKTNKHILYVGQRHVILTLEKMEEAREAAAKGQPFMCDNTRVLCNGGRAFSIRDKMFCSPCCGNQHFNLTPSDADFWEHKCYECFDCESVSESEDED
jgi:hypothetical protein